MFIKAIFKNKMAGVEFRATIGLFGIVVVILVAVGMG